MTTGLQAGQLYNFGVYLRRCGQRRAKQDGSYWALVESERVAGKPRQRVVAYLGDVRKEYGQAVQRAAECRDSVQPGLFDTLPPEYVEIDFKSVHVERARKFGGYWLGLQIVEKLGLRELFEEKIPRGREQVPWSLMALVLILCRLCDPSSELHIAEQIAHHSALADLLGIGQPLGMPSTPKCSVPVTATVSAPHSLIPARACASSPRIGISSPLTSMVSPRGCP